jgi:hypothetical protein
VLPFIREHRVRAWWPLFDFSDQLLCLLDKMGNVHPLAGRVCIHARAAELGGYVTLLAASLVKFVA